MLCLDDLPGEKDRISRMRVTLSLQDSLFFAGLVMLDYTDACKIRLTSGTRVSDGDHNAFNTEDGIIDNRCESQCGCGNASCFVARAIIGCDSQHTK